MNHSDRPSTPESFSMVTDASSDGDARAATRSLERRHEHLVRLTTFLAYFGFAVTLVSAGFCDRADVGDFPVRRPTLRHELVIGDGDLVAVATGANHVARSEAA